MSQTSADGQRIRGEFIDHVIVTGGFHALFSAVTPSVLSVPERDYSDWQDDYSDHFPVMVDFVP